MPVDALVAHLIAAARDAFTQARAQHPAESFYCYALYTDDLAMYILPTCSGEQGLRQVAREYVDHSGGTVTGQADDLRWSPADSPYHLLGEEHFNKVDELLQSRGDPYELDDDACETEVDARFEACFLALAQLDAEGFFGRGVDRDRVVVTVLQGDQSDRSRLANAQRLNPPVTVERLVHDLQVPEPVGDFVTLGSKGAYQITALSYAPDTRLLVACGSGGELFAWDLSSGRELLATVHHDANYWDAAISSDGQMLVVAENERLLRIELPSGARRDLEVQGRWRVAVSSDGATVIAGQDGTVWASSIATARRRWQLDRPASCLRLTTDGTLLALAGDGPTSGVVLVDTVDGSIQHELILPASPTRYCLAWSPDGQVLATGDQESGHVRTWHRQASWIPGEVLKPPSTAISGISLLDAPTDLAFSPNGALLASAHSNGDVHVWDADTGGHLHRLRGLQESMKAVVFIDDHHLAAAGRDVDTGSPVCIWTV